jgi:hypothetical protein
LIAPFKRLSNRRPEEEEGAEEALRWRRGNRLPAKADSGGGGGGAMAKRLVARMMGMFRSRTQVGVDRAGNNYYSLVEEVDGASTCPLPRPSSIVFLFVSSFLM